MAKRQSVWKLYSYTWVTAGLFLFSLAGHWTIGWFAFVHEQVAQHQAAEFASYAIEALRDTLENWQSEFLQLIWQVAGLAYLLHIGSPQSKEGDDRKEEKIDLILRAVLKDGGEEIRRLEAKYPRP